MISPFRACLLLAAAPLLSMPDCDGDEPARRHFDGPQSIAIGPYGDALPRHPYAFVADDNNRAIRLLDVDDRDREERLPTGRRLGALITHTGSDGSVDAVWAIDRDSGEVVRFTLAEALTPTATEPVFSGTGLEMEVEVVPGRTPSSTWTVTYREGFERWEVRSVAGVDEELAKTGDAYTADEKAVKFTIRKTGGEPAEGDTFTFETDNGLDVVAVSSTGRAVNLAAVSADTAVVALGEPASLVAFSLETGVAAATFALAPGAIPGGMELAPDESALWITDLGNPLVYRLETAGLPAAWTLTPFPLAVPARDVAVTGDGLRLFTLAADADDIFVHQLPEMVPVDLVGITPDIDPLPLRTAIRALSGARRAHVMRGSDVPGYPVLATTHAGNVFFLNGATGCADYADERGPRLTGIRYRDAALPSNPSFDLDTFDVTPCGGFIRNENWVLTYDGLLDGWRVEGTVTGKQQNVLYEGQVYITDRGELTMRIVGDEQLPSDDGDQFVFSITDGITPLTVGLIPDRPVYAVVGTGEDEVEYALIGNAASDTVAQVNVRRRRVSKTYR